MARRRLVIHKRPPPGKTAPDDSGLSADEKFALIMEQIRTEAEALSDKHTRDLWQDAIATFEKTGDLKSLVDICMWRRSVVPIDQFLFDPAYMGISEDEIYPAVYDACCDLDTDRFVEAVLTGAIGSGKSTVANIMLCRNLFKISCMRHPQTSFGLQAKSSIVFSIQSVRFSTAKKAIFEELGQYIHNSPYFSHVYTYDRRVASQMIFREHNVTIMPVTSSTTGAISMNVIGGILDEVNFMQKIEKSKSADADLDGSFDQAKELYNILSRRRRSRFTRKGRLPGMLFLISSSRYPDDFTEEKAKESSMAGGRDDSIYVFRHSQWSSKARNTFLDEEFRVQVGNERIRSKVLLEGEETHPECQSISVPMDFYNEFIKDTDGALRDYAGVTTIATHPFFSQRDRIYACMTMGEKYGYHNLFNVEEIDLSIGIPRPKPERLRHDIDMFRACHVDLSLNHDGCGIAIGHIAGSKIVERFNEERGITETEILPVIGFDLVMRIVPPPGGEIEFANVRRLIIELRDRHRLDIRYVTFDGFNSIDSRQILRKANFQTDYQSVEAAEPYRSLRDAIYDGRVLLPNHNLLVKELSELEISVKNNKEKIDHRPRGSKDVADAVCGVVAFLLKRRMAWSNFAFSTKNGLHLLGNYARQAFEDTKTGGEPVIEIQDGEVPAGASRTGRPVVKRRNPARRPLGERPSLEKKAS